MSGLVILFKNAKTQMDPVTSHPHHFPPRIPKRSPWCPIPIVFDTECVFVHQNLRFPLFSTQNTEMDPVTSHPHHFPLRIPKRSPWCPIPIIFNTECVFVHQNSRFPLFRHRIQKWTSGVARCMIFHAESGFRDGISSKSQNVHGNQVSVRNPHGKPFSCSEQKVKGFEHLRSPSPGSSLSLGS